VSAFASTTFASQADFSPALLFEKARAYGGFEMTKRKNVFISMLARPECPVGAGYFGASYIR
jgi:hypothetical protein